MYIFSFNRKKESGCVCQNSVTWLRQWQSYKTVSFTQTPADCLAAHNGIAITATFGGVLLSPPFVYVGLSVSEITRKVADGFP